MNKYIIILIIVIFSGITSSIFGQNSQKKWPEIPGLHHGGPITLTNEKIFIRVAGAAAVSYALAKYIFKSETQGDFWQARMSYSGGDNKHVIKENFGAERHIASWFAVSLELSFQQWADAEEGLDKKHKFGMGIGLQPYFRWYLFGKKRISPFLEYGTGFFQGFKKFPYNGTTYTFTHSSHLGIEYKLTPGSRLRLSYGQFHQSNNDWWDVNPSYNGNGFNFTFSWKIKESKKGKK